MRFGRLMCFWQSLRPHFLCRYCDRKFARRPPKPIASVVMRHSKKRKKTDSLVEKSLTNCPLFLDFWTILQRQNSLTFQLLLCGQFLADFLRKEFDFLHFDYDEQRLKFVKLQLYDWILNWKTKWTLIVRLFYILELQSHFNSFLHFDN